MTALLNGSGSYDSTGQPLLFYWRQISGPSNSFLQTPAQGECMVYNLNSPGDYSYELKVWNNREMDFDTTVISVGIPSYCQSSRSEVPVSLTFLSNYPGQGQIPEIIVAGSKLVMPEWWDQSNGVPGNKIYMYDLLSQNWNTIQASTARIGVATVAAGNKVFFAGGMDGWDGNYNVTPVVDIYDLTTNTWSVSNLSEARGYCKAVVSGSKIFFAGGLNSSNVLSNKVDIYDLVTNNWSSAVLPSGAKQVGAAREVCLFINTDRCKITFVDLQASGRPLAGSKIINVYRISRRCERIPPSSWVFVLSVPTTKKNFTKSA